MDSSTFSVWRHAAYSFHRSLIGFSHLFGICPGTPAGNPIRPRHSKRRLPVPNSVELQIWSHDCIKPGNLQQMTVTREMAFFQRFIVPFHCTNNKSLLSLPILLFSPPQHSSFLLLILHNLMPCQDCFIVAPVGILLLFTKNLIPPTPTRLHVCLKRPFASSLLSGIL